ncbi:MAG: hypothetical protein JXA00_01395 [Candidatus Thermoplasmatota archaeon]|nr:hypothetical protein [Candidatus Thermoplasmatota archaeon]
MPVIRMDALTRAIQQKLGVSEAEAHGYAELILDMFGFHDMIIDNTLDHHDRKVFYHLQSQGLLNTRQEDVLLYDGRTWRIHYWVFLKQFLQPTYQRRKTTAPIHSEPVVSSPPQDLYLSLPTKTWTARRTPSG